VNNLSPRTIAKMDRTSLELETQTLLRHLEVLVGEKKLLSSAVDMHEFKLRTASSKLQATQDDIQSFESEPTSALMRAKQKSEVLKEL
jgi:hypothetical protein